MAPGEGFAVLGWSWGGYVARGVIHRMLKRIDGAMLFVPEIDWGPPGKRVAAPKQRLYRDAHFQAARRGGEEWLDDMLVVQTVPNLEHVRRTFAREVDHPDTDAAFHKQDGGFTFDPDALPEPCPAPALILTGRQDNITGYRQAWAILDNFPRATYAVLDRAGHLLQIEQPGLFAALMHEWLDRVEEYAAQRARD